MHDEGCELRTGSTNATTGCSPRATSPRATRSCSASPGRPAPANHSHANQVSLTEWVFEDGLGPKVNHSCDPNCGVRVNADVDGFDFVALAPIAAGEEITFDYAMRNYVIEHFPATLPVRSPTPAAARSRAGRTCRRSARPPTGLVAPYLRAADRARAHDASLAAI